MNALQYAGEMQVYSLVGRRSFDTFSLYRGIQPLIEEILNRHLGADHGIEVRANGLTVREDGSWKVVWRDSRYEKQACVMRSV